MQNSPKCMKYTNFCLLGLLICVSSYIIVIYLTKPFKETPNQLTWSVKKKRQQVESFKKNSYQFRRPIRPRSNHFTIHSSPNKLIDYELIYPFTAFIPVNIITPVNSLLKTETFLNIIWLAHEISHVILLYQIWALALPGLPKCSMGGVV